MPHAFGVPSIGHACGTAPVKALRMAILSPSAGVHPPDPFKIPSAPTGERETRSNTKATKFFESHENGKNATDPQQSALLATLGDVVRWNETTIRDGERGSLG